MATTKKAAAKKTAAKKSTASSSTTWKDRAKTEFGLTDADLDGVTKIDDLGPVVMNRTAQSRDWVARRLVEFKKG